ncbi:unnamed protein product [Phytophthora lilii]|uniref:Unnamed protein product n=1 Tax=Phytophthora lilii TaxID=2077276 RepID=A0A9W6U3L1_9STRA|nr:unnamed protein product [Phytophthora lilii]
MLCARAGSGQLQRVLGQRDGEARIPRVWLLASLADAFQLTYCALLSVLGFSLFVKKTSTKPDGVAVFWDAKKLKVKESLEISLDLPNGDESDIDHELLSRASQRGSVGAVVHFEHLETPLEFVVATTHLFWDPMQEDVKLVQSRRMLLAVEAFTGALDASTPVIFSGDFNSLPDSKVYSFITGKNQFKSAYSQYDPEGEPKFTNVNGDANTDDGKKVPRFVGTLDYIFYRSPSAHGAHVVRGRQQGSRFAQHHLSVGPPPAAVRVPHPASQLNSSNRKHHVEVHMATQPNVIIFPFQPITTRPKNSANNGSVRHSSSKPKLGRRCAMGASSSSPAAGSAALEHVFASAQEKAAFEKIVGEAPVLREDAAYHTVLAASRPLPQLSQAQVELLTSEYGETLGKCKSVLQCSCNRVELVLKLVR